MSTAPSRLERALAEPPERVPALQICTSLNPAAAAILAQPPLAVECVLADVVPALAIWSDAAISFAEVRPAAGDRALSAPRTADAAAGLLFGFYVVVFVFGCMSLCHLLSFVLSWTCVAL